MTTHLKKTKAGLSTSAITEFTSEFMNEQEGSGLRQAQSRTIWVLVVEEA
ncbi:hypothetical protein [Nostoc sp.]